MRRLIHDDEIAKRFVKNISVFGKYDTILNAAHRVRRYDEYILTLKRRIHIIVVPQIYQIFPINWSVWRSVHIQRLIRAPGSSMRQVHIILEEEYVFVVIFSLCLINWIFKVKYQCDGTLYEKTSDTNSVGTTCTRISNTIKICSLPHGQISTDDRLIDI